jgi:HPt (histidine-containing phosphotransfer) domain-containing protein
MDTTTEPHPHAARVLVQVPQGIPRDMMVGFLSRCSSSIGIVRAASERGDFDSVRVFGHRLKGIGGAYSLPKLTEIGAAIERAAVDKNSGELQRLVVTVDAYLGQLEVAPA